MRKRLRKKLRFGEFRELGFTLGFHLQADWQEDRRDRFIYSFLDDCVEPQGLGFLGGGCYEPLRLLARDCHTLPRARR